MKNFYKAVQISDHVYWVGAIDWNSREFHGYTTRRGTSYNAYLVMADKITLIDTVRIPFKEEMLSRIASVTDPKDIKIVTQCTHRLWEPKHWGRFLTQIMQSPP